MTDKPQPLTDRERALISVLGGVVGMVENAPPTIRDFVNVDMARALLGRIERETSEAAQAQAEAWQEWGDRISRDLNAQEKRQS